MTQTKMQSKKIQIFFKPEQKKKVKLKFCPKNEKK